MCIAFVPSNRVCNSCKCVSLLLLLLMLGCAEDDGRIPVVKTTGQLVWPEGDVQGLMIALHPLDPNAPRIPVQPTGVIQADGRFELMSYDVGDGVPPGEYIVTVREAPRPDGAPKVTLPAKKFLDPKTSPLRVTIEDKGINDLPPLIIAE
jgi:hypothetical protein